MIVVTGAAGFIGSYLVGKLNLTGHNDLVLVDHPQKDRNLQDKKYREFIHRAKFFGWLRKNAQDVEFIFRLGAKSDITETTHRFTNSLFELLAAAVVYLHKMSSTIFICFIGGNLRRGRMWVFRFVQ